jgi:hypothetical protein
MNVIGDFDINDKSLNDKLKVLNKDDDILTAEAAIICQHQLEDAKAPPGADDIYAINKEIINILTYEEKEFMKKLLILFKNDNLKRKLWKLSDAEYDYYIENEYNVEIQKSKDNNTIYGIKLLEDNKLWFYTMGM